MPLSQRFKLAVAGVVSTATITTTLATGVMTLGGNFLFTPVFLASLYALDKTMPEIWDWANDKKPPAPPAPQMS